MYIKEFSELASVQSLNIISLAPCTSFSLRAFHPYIVLTLCVRWTLLELFFFYPYRNFNFQTFNCFAFWSVILFLLTYSTIRTFFSFQGEFDETSGESSPSPARYGTARVMHAPTPEDRNAKTMKKFRLRSLDTFRGWEVIIQLLKWLVL